MLCRCAESSMFSIWTASNRCRFRISHKTADIRTRRQIQHVDRHWTDEANRSEASFSSDGDDTD